MIFKWASTSAPHLNGVYLNEQLNFRRLIDQVGQAFPYFSRDWAHSPSNSHCSLIKWLSHPIVFPLYFCIFFDQDFIHGIITTRGVHDVESVAILCCSLRSHLDSMLNCVANNMPKFSSNAPPLGSGLTDDVSPLDNPTGCHNNRGLKSLTVSDGGKTLWALMESALNQEGGLSRSTERYARLLKYDVTKPQSLRHTREYVVPLPV